MSLLAPTLQSFFTDRLLTQKNASPRTLDAYRNAFRLLLGFAEQQTGKPPCQLDFADLDAPLIGAFLEHLEHDRGNTTRTRNARLAAIHSLFRYAALRHPEHAASIARVIEIPHKRCAHATVSYLTSEEIHALVRSPDRTTWLGRRDHALLLLAIQTGLRVSELVGLQCSHVGAVRWRSRALRRQGPQATLHTAGKRDHRGPPHLARRAPRRPRGSTVPHQARRTTQPGRRRLASRQTHTDSSTRLSLAHAKARDTTRPQTHQRDDAASGRR